MPAPVGSLNDMFTTVQQAVTGELAASLSEPALALLGASVAIVLVKQWLEHFGDADAMGWIMGSTQVIVWGTIAGAIIKNIEAVGNYIFKLMYGVMGLFGTAASGGNVSGENMLGWFWDETVEIGKAIFDFTISSNISMKDALEAGASCKFSDPTCTKLTDALQNLQGQLFDNGMGMLIAMVAIVLMLLFLAVVLIQIVRGFFIVAIGVGFLPITLGFFPIMDSWWRKNVSVIAGGIAFMGSLAFLLGVVTNVVKQMTAGLSSDKSLDALKVLSGVHIESKALAALIICLMIVMIALAMGSVLERASGIFDSPAGMLGVSVARGQQGGDATLPESAPAAPSFNTPVPVGPSGVRSPNVPPPFYKAPPELASPKTAATAGLPPPHAPKQLEAPSIKLPGGGELLSMGAFRGDGIKSINRIDPAHFVERARRGPEVTEMEKGWDGKYYEKSKSRFSFS